MQSSTTTITGLSHLEGQTVKVWADGYIAPDATVGLATCTVLWLALNAPGASMPKSAVTSPLIAVAGAISVSSTVLVSMVARIGVSSCELGDEVLPVLKKDGIPWQRGGLQLLPPPSSRLIFLEHPHPGKPLRPFIVDPLRCVRTRIDADIEQLSGGGCAGWRRARSAASSRASTSTPT